MSKIRFKTFSGSCSRRTRRTRRRGGGGGEEDERRTRQEEEEAPDIKSNNPHLAGGEFLSLNYVQNQV